MSLRPFEAKVICMTFEINSKLGVLTQAGKKLNSFGVTFGKNRSMCIGANILQNHVHNHMYLDFLFFHLYF